MFMVQLTGVSCPHPQKFWPTCKRWNSHKSLLTFYVTFLQDWKWSQHACISGQLLSFNYCDSANLFTQTGRNQPKVIKKITFSYCQKVFKIKPPPELKIVNGEVIKTAMLPCLTLKPTYLQPAALVGCGRRTTPKQCCGRHCLASPDNKSTLVMRSGLVSGGELCFEMEEEEQQLLNFLSVLNW